MGDEESIIQINTDDTSIKMSANWIEKVNNELNQLNESRSIETKRWEGESIYRIPWSLKKLCVGAYQPQTVSIGPYHHGAKSLKAMEKHKQRALLNFLDSNNKPLQCYINALAQVVEKLMGAYDQLQPKWKQNTEAFLQLMIVDGCFILEVLEAAAASWDEWRRMTYASNDPVFSLHGRLYFGPFIRRDLLMLENQIPLLALNIILLVADGGGDLLSKERYLIAQILKFFQRPHEITSGDDYSRPREIQFLSLPPLSTPCTPKEIEVGGYENCLHILDLYRKSQLLQEHHPRKPRSCWPKTSASKEEVEPFIRSATELLESGIRFKKSETTKLNDISFHRGVLKLPSIDVDDALESEYLNMMALERFHAEAGSGMTSYVFLMDRLIDTAEDVSLLHWRRIIRNSLGNDEAVARLFNSLSKETCLDPDNRLYEVHKEVTRYYRSPVRRWMAYAKHNYFTNTWVTLSIVAAVLLFALTTVQTVYAILDYHPSSKSN